MLKPSEDHRPQLAWLWQWNNCVKLSLDWDCLLALTYPTVDSGLTYNLN